MQPIAADSSLVCQSVGLSVTIVSTAKMPEPINLLFGMLSEVGSETMY